MNKILSLLFLLSTSLLCHAHGGGNYEHSDMLASMKPGDKAALLMVHFGTTHDDTRALTIERARHHEADSTGCHAETAQRRLHTPHRAEHQHH